MADQITVSSDAPDMTVEEAHNQEIVRKRLRKQNTV